MKIAVPAEADKSETRVAATPETVKKFVALGAEVAVQAGAGAGLAISDEEFAAAGASIARRPRAPSRTPTSSSRSAARRRPSSRATSPGALVVAAMDPYGNEAELKAIADANVGRVRHGIHAAHHPRPVDGRPVEPGQPRRLPGGDRRRREYGRAFPMMMTAAGTVPAAQASSSWAPALPACRRSPPPAASARWSPPPTSGPRPRSRWKSLGAKFIAVEDEEFKQAETAGGYAKPMSAEYQAEAGGAGRRTHQEAGHRHHHGADPRPAGAEAGVRRRWSRR